jgi:hypothetical protein
VEGSVPSETRRETARRVEAGNVWSTSHSG